MEESNSVLKNIERKIQKNFYELFVILLAVLFIILILNAGVTVNSNVVLGEKVEEINEFNKPVKIELNIIECNGCSDISPVIDTIKNQNVEIVNEQNFYSGSEEAKSLINKYGIKKLPTVLIFGEIDSDKVNFNNFELINDALVLNKINAPYFDLASNKLKGAVSIIEIVDTSCEKCVGLTSIPLSFSESGVFIDNWKKHEYNSVEGREIISKFGVTQVPALLISEDIDYYEEVKKSLSQLDLIKKQGFYVMHSVIPPYRELDSNKVVGLVDLIMLKDNSCGECYDVTTNKRILQQLGVAINSENTYDINSPNGKNLISKYDIKKAPMIMLSPEANAYDLFVQAWKPVGSVEKDGWFIMRNPEKVGIVRDLADGEIIK